MAKRVVYIIVCILLATAGLLWLAPKNNASNITPAENNSFNALSDGSAISTLIVPHHDLVAQARQSILKVVAAKHSYKTIILVSPNHFNAGDATVVLSSRDWKVGDELIAPNTSIINGLISAGYPVEEKVFENEHGIKNVMADLPSAFPDAKIVPIVVKQDVSRAEIEKFGNELNKYYQADCLLIASVDFSHYQPSSLAQLHDNLSIRGLTNMNQDEIWRSEVDSPQSLSLAALWAKSAKTEKFVLSQNTNSDIIAGERDSESTSYVLGWYENSAQIQSNNDFSFLFAGDMMFDRGIDYHFRGLDIYKVFDHFGQRVFWGTDLSVANLEGPISPTPIQADNTGGNMIFNFPPLVPSVLNWLHIGAVGLANNHTNNNGLNGYNNTVKVLGEKNIISVGQESTISDNSSKTFTAGNQKVTVIAINVLEVGGNITEQIKKAKAEGGFVVVYPHWGVEYAKTHSSSQAALAHLWINNGADLIIGSHPHVVEDAEMYQGKPIFYSLGNFLFDQDFSKQTQEGLMVGGKIESGKLTQIILLPTKSVKYQPELMNGTEKTTAIERLRSGLNLPGDINAFDYDIIKL